jgi:hypothetical protein
MIERVKWYLKQIFPLTYRTNYRDEDHAPHYCVWNMWFGYSYNIDDVVIAE